MKLKTFLCTTALVISAAAGTTLVAEPQQHASSQGCTTVQPGPDWTCHNGGWYPPGMTLPGGRSTAPAPRTSGSDNTCTTMQPAPDWVCYRGGWIPPGMPLPGNATTRPPAASAPPSAPSGCSTPSPGAGWRCANGGWYPPGMAIPGQAQPVTPVTRPAPAPGGCTTPKPGDGWVCANGGWYPPGMPIPGGTPAAQGGGTSTPQPAPQPRTAPQEPPRPAPDEPQPATPATGGRLRVMTWNIHFGHGNPAGQARAIAESGADVVLLQEVATYDEDMPSTYPARLRELTGQQWHAVWAPHSGYGNSQGTLILSRLPLVSKSTLQSHGHGFGQAVVSVGGVKVSLLNVHLAWEDTGQRSAQLEDFLSWGREIGGARIAGGDFNSWWGEWWIKQTENDYRDTWQEVTGSDENGYTLNGAVRFDYLFRSYDEQWRLIPTDCRVLQTGLSDHAAVIADYSVR